MVVSPRWEDERTVAGFRGSPPNQVLVHYARKALQELGGRPRALDLGCGAARNAVALARMGYEVVGTDLSAPMLVAARERAAAEAQGFRVDLVRAPMTPLPFRDGSFDLVVAHGIWNLARTDAELRAAVADAARVGRHEARLFLFTFARKTLPPDDEPVPGQQMVFTQFAGEPQCFLTERQVLEELHAAGWRRDTPGPLTQYNRDTARARGGGGPPAIYEGTFVRR